MRNQIADQNDNLARTVAYRWIGRCPEPIEDITQIARIGLIKAVEKFDPDEGSAFSSFAVPYINGELQHYIRDHFGLLKIPRRAFEQAGQVRRLCKRMAALGRPIEESEAAAALGIDAKRWAWISSAVQRKQTAALDEINEPIDESDRDPLSLQRIKLQEVLTTLPSQQRRCLTEKFFEQHSDEAIAKGLNLSVVQVQEIIAAAIKKLNLELKTYAEC